MNINKVNTSTEIVIDRVCDLRDEITYGNEAYKALLAKYHTTLNLLRDNLPKDKVDGLLELEESYTAADVFLQEALYMQGVQDGRDQVSEGRDLSKYPGALKVEDIARYLRIGRVQAYNMVHREDFPKIIDGKNIRIPKAAFEKWLNTAAFK